MSEEKIIRIKTLREEMDAMEQRVISELATCDRANAEEGRTLSLVRTNLQQARMWAGMTLQALGQPHPYVQGLDTSHAIIDPPADKAKA